MFSTIKRLMIMKIDIPAWYLLAMSLGLLLSAITIATK